MSSKTYFLDQDNDCHWYIVHAANRKEWEAWRDSSSENVPSFAEMLNFPLSKIEFYLVKDL